MQKRLKIRSGDEAHVTSLYCEFSAVQHGYRSSV